MNERCSGSSIFKDSPAGSLMAGPRPPSKEPIIVSPGMRLITARNNTSLSLLIDGSNCLFVCIHQSVNQSLGSPSITNRQRINTFHHVRGSN